MQCPAVDFYLTASVEALDYEFAARRRVTRVVWRVIGSTNISAFICPVFVSEAPAPEDIALIFFYSGLFTLDNIFWFIFY